MREYHKHFPVSAPEEDYEDRNRLYSMYVSSNTQRIPVWDIAIHADGDGVAIAISVLRRCTRRRPSFGKCEYAPSSR